MISDSSAYAVSTRPAPGPATIEYLTATAIQEYSASDWPATQPHGLNEHLAVVERRQIAIERSNARLDRRRAQSGA
jgi:hypothetical protein